MRKPKLVKTIRQYVPPVLILIVAAIWGSSYLIARDLVTHSISPGFYLLIRFSLAVPIVYFVFRKAINKSFIELRQNQLKNKATIRRFAIPGLFFAAAFVLQGYGLRNADAGIAAVLTSLFFVFVPVFHMLHGNFSKPLKYLLPLIFAALGTLLIFIDDINWTEGSLNANHLLIVAGAACYGGWLYFNGKLDHNVHFAARFVGHGAMVILIAGICSFVFREFGSIAFGLDVWIRLAFLVAVATVICFLLLNWAQSRGIEDLQVALLLAFEPVAGLTTAFLFDDAAYGGKVIIGSTLIFVASITASIIDNKFK